MEKTLEELNTVHDVLKRFSPKAVLLDLIKRENNEYIVLYRDENPCAYVIHHLSLNNIGLYFGRYYASGYDAWMDFDSMR